jgi:hypothetical protein
MMPEFFKGKPMFKSLVVLICAVLLLPAGAQTQNQGQSSGKAKSSQAAAQAKIRAADDLTARLQARAIAEAAAHNKTTQPARTKQPAAAVQESGASGFVVAPRPTEAQAQVPMQPLPAWTDAQATRRDAPAAPSLPVVPAMAAVPALTVVPMTTPVAVGLTTTSPVPTGASDPLSQDLAIAQQIHQGLMPCEMGASVRVEADAAAPGYFHVLGKGFRYRMYPVHTTTGALRLEDKKAGAVWLQLANKSMLMDQKKGRRMADDCAHPEQVAYGQDMKNNPPPSLFDKTGMGRPND